MGVEIERKFLVDHDKWKGVLKPEGRKIRQGYLLNANLKNIRIRIFGDEAFVTFKGATSGITRREYEYAIPVSDAAELLDNFAEAEIAKTRFCLEIAGNVWEVDVFEGDNEGLIMAEIELDTEDDTFDTPPWIGAEVSDDDRYYNSNLSIHPFKSWK